MSITAFRTPVRLDVDCMAVIGTLKHDIMGIRYEGTAGGNAPAAPAAPVDAQLGNPPAPVVPGAPNPTAPAPVAPAPTAPLVPTTAEIPPAINPATGKPYTPAETQNYITTLRGEAKTNREAREAADRTAADATAQRDAVLAALGLKPDGSKADLTPEQLQAELASRNSAVDAQARENLVLRVSGKPEIMGDADKMLDSKSFNDKLSALKSDDKDGVEALVKQWVTDHPEHKVTSAAASSGGVSHTGTTPPTGRKSMGDAVAARYTSPTP